MENLENTNLQTKKTFWQKIKNPLFFTLGFLPVIIVAVIFTCLYTFDLYPPEMLEEAIATVGSKTVVILISAIQSVGMICLATFFGYIVAKKLGLLPSIKKETDSATYRPRAFSSSLTAFSPLKSIFYGLLYTLRSLLYSIKGRHSGLSALPFTV